ncbi:MAG TPA: TrkA C-terminal domain-containing protein [Blastocatellia bacterium]|nr:TrkA C-terminal domain-containing protein [Blastocatellia bacterium]
MALIALILVIVISAVTVKVGTVALVMTGLDRRRAAFQALSALTNTGWTTRETELLMSHDQRRRIVMILMVLGHAGLASTVATLMLSLSQRDAGEVLESLAILAGVILAMYLLARWRHFDRHLTAEIEKRLRQTSALRVTNFEEVLMLAEGYGVFEVYVTEQSQIANKTIGQLRLRSRGMLVLAVDRAGRVIPAPHEKTLLLPGDRLICYGQIESVQGIAEAQAAADLPAARQQAPGKQQGRIGG